MAANNNADEGGNISSAKFINIHPPGIKVGQSFLAFWLKCFYTEAYKCNRFERVTDYFGVIEGDEMAWHDE